MSKYIKVNEADWDRIVRIIAGGALEVLAWGGVVAGVLGVILGVVGVILLVTGIVGFCPLYALLGIRTNKS